MRNNVKLPSGRRGWRGRLHEVYTSREQFLAYNDTYKIAATLGYDDPDELWDENPLIEGSVDPADYRVHKK